MEIKNLKRAMKRLDKIRDMDFRPLVKKAVVMVENEAKALVPVDTGNLRSSIHPEVKAVGSAIVGRVYTQSEYAPYVEFGTGIKGKGTYPFNVPGMSLEYRNTPWSYEDEATGERIWTAGHQAQPFMFPALRNSRNKVLLLTKAEIQRMVQKAINGGG